MNNHKMWILGLESVVVRSTPHNSINVSYKQYNSCYVEMYMSSTSWIWMFSSLLCVRYVLASSELFLVFFQDRTFQEFAVSGVYVWGNFFFLVLFFGGLVAFVFVVFLFIFKFLTSASRFLSGFQITVISCWTTLLGITL